MLFTKREIDVLKLLSEGLNNPAIADRLFIKIKTVEHHINTIYNKLKSDNYIKSDSYPRIMAIIYYKNNLKETNDFT